MAESIAIQPPAGIPIIQTDEPCVVCGKEIQPGQLYVPRPEHGLGPRHLGCKP